jgi:hypothetical protein
MERQRSQKIFKKIKNVEKSNIYALPHIVRKSGSINEVEFTKILQNRIQSKKD